MKCPDCGNAQLDAQPNGELCCLACYWQESTTDATELLAAARAREDARTEQNARNPIEKRSRYDE